MQREITDNWLRTVEIPTTGRLEIWDAKESGLVLRLTAGGATWSVRARTRDGKRTRPKIGTYPAMSISAARKRARAVLVDIQGGADPVAAKQTARAEREARAGLPTVGDRIADWQKARAKDWSKRYAAEVARIIKADIPPSLAKRPLAETTRADWTALVADKRKVASKRRKDRKPATSMASALYRVCSAFLGYAEAHGWIETPLGTGDDRATGSVARPRADGHGNQGDLEGERYAQSEAARVRAAADPDGRARTGGGGHCHRRNRPRGIPVDHTGHAGEERGVDHATARSRVDGRIAPIVAG